MTNLYGSDYIIAHSVFTNESSRKEICKHIKCQYDAMCDCLGDDFVDLMLESKIAYNADDFNPHVDYNINSLVTYCGYCYKKTKSTNDSCTPDESKYWERCPIFNDDCLNQIYDYIGSWIVYVITIEALPFIIYNLDDSGLMVATRDEHGDRSATIDEQKRFESKLYKRCAKQLKSMKRFITKLCDNNECEILRSISFINNLCGDECHEDNSTGGNVAWGDGRN